MSQQPNGTAGTQTESDQKRHCFPSRKALQNVIETKRKELDAHARILQDAYNKLERERYDGDDVQPVQTAAENYKETLNQLTELYQQDQWGDFKEEAKLTREYSRLERAHHVIAQAASKHSCERMSQVSRGSRRSSASRASSSSSARRKALAEVAAARKQAEFDKLMAEKERTRRLQEAEEQRKKEEQRAQYELDMALLAADRATAIADARLQAIEGCIKEEEELEDNSLDLPDVQGQHNTEERVKTWVNAHADTLPTPGTRQVPPSHPITTLTPKQDHTIGLLETFTTTNQRLVSGLSKQSLPKCHPDVFDGDVTLFHPWKRAFKAMIADADVTPAQEMNYLRNFTKGDVQNVVDNFRRRHHPDLSFVLQELWTELERRFGNTAAITNALLERLTQTAKFSEKDLQGLQTFADLCGDVDSQLAHLPGLSCLNYPNVRLPIFLRSKWEKEIVKYAAKNHDTYPDFHVFAYMVQGEARKKNHPNVQASGVQTTTHGERPSKKAAKDNPTSTRRVLKTNTGKEEANRRKFHNRDGHTLMECKAFNAMTREEKTDWISREKLCFRCVEPNHVAKECKTSHMH